MTRLYVIAATTPDGVIGVDGRLPWRNAADMRRFRELTAGRDVLMGRRTAESLPKPLADRRNMVLSRSGYAREGFEVFGSFAEALEALEDEVVWVIGGAEVYRKALTHPDLAGVDLTILSPGMSDAGGADVTGGIVTLLPSFALDEGYVSLSSHPYTSRALLLQWKASVV